MSLPRLLLDADVEAMSLRRHIQVHGHITSPGRRGRSGEGAGLLSELARSGLRGRGGGAYPLAAKVAAVVRARRQPALVVNGSEGEPMSVKDQMLLESLPHLVLDGALVLARAVRAPDLRIAIAERFEEAAEAVDVALDERVEAGELSSGSRPQIQPVPGGYVKGQETAIVNLLNAGVARPTTQPPRITERGVGRRPTLMANVETLAHVALIARHGADWFRQLGPSDEPGSALITLGGGVREPGVYEIEQGAHLGTLVEAAGGLTEPARAFLFGGYAGTWVDAASARQARLSNGALGRLRASLGAGVVVALPQSACPVAEVARVAAWLSLESAGQCGPCVNGLGSIAATLADVQAGSAQRQALADVRRWAQLAVGRGACAHPDGAARFVTSAVHVFRSELEDHLRHGPCDGCERRPVLITPSWERAPA